MENDDLSKRRAGLIVKRYKSIGFFGGVILGSMVGIMVAGPNFEKWTASRSLLTTLGSMGLGGFVGYLAGEIALATEAVGRGSGIGGGPGSESSNGTGNFGSVDSGGSEGDS